MGDKNFNYTGMGHPRTSKQEMCLFRVNTGSTTIYVVAENLTQVVNRYSDAEMVENLGEVTIL